MGKEQQKASLAQIGKRTNRELKSICAQLSDGLTPEILEELIDKYGYETIVSLVVSSTAAEATN